ncbi:MAG: hypothetical protein OZ934_00585 [Anaerolineae bacterium]|nr:hypothetical protein [Anaerolineae bacterium]
MAKKKRKPDNTPRRKRFKRAQHLEAAKSWLSTYEGKDIVEGSLSMPTAYHFRTHFRDCKPLYSFGFMRLKGGDQHRE